MRTISFRALRRLAVLPDAPAKTEKLFEWYLERQKQALQATTAFLSAFLVALIVGALKGDYGDNWLLVSEVTLVAVGGAGSLIVRSYLMMQRMEEEFVSAIRLMSLSH